MNHNWENYFDTESEYWKKIQKIYEENESFPKKVVKERNLHHKFPRSFSKKDGVDIDNDIAFKGVTRNFEVGKLHLNGKEALEYARERKKMPSGDYTRGLHQEKIIEAIINKVTTSKKILNSYSKFTSVLDEFIQTNIPSSTIKSYVREQIDTMPSWTVISRAVDSSGSALVETYSMPGMNLYVAFPDENSVKTASTIINGMLENKKYDTINK